MNIGENIKRFRKEHGLTQKELGERLNMTQSAIGQFENNTTSPKLETIEKIAAALEITAFDLMGYEYWDMKYPDLAKDSAEFETFIDYLKTIGFSLDFSMMPDDYTVILTHDQHQAVFTQAEFEELQSAAKEVIEGKFYRKVLEQQENK